MSEFIHGDCLLAMQDLPDKSVDLLLTDPPNRLGVNLSRLNATRNSQKSRKSGLLTPDYGAQMNKLVAICKNNDIFNEKEKL